MDSDTKALTDERGKHYGNPLDHFSTTQHLWAAWRYRRTQVFDLKDMENSDMERRELAFRHAVYMICDKLARAANDPMHVDNWRDIQGYSACAMMVLGLDNEGKQ